MRGRRRRLVGRCGSGRPATDTEGQHQQTAGKKVVDNALHMRLIRHVGGAPARGRADLDATGDEPNRMTAYLIRRIWQMVPTLIGVVLLVFLLFKQFGGDPAEILAP